MTYGKTNKKYRIEQMSRLSGHDIIHEKNEFKSLVCLFNYIDIRASIRIQFL